jgi:glycosyltransferase involved in cell wall biosynthesis
MLAATDIFVMPSLDEGLGLAVAEAQLAGLPVVASNIPGIREALCPSMHQFCRPPLDATGMAEQVILLLENHQLRSRLGHEGREYVTKRFSIDRTVKQLESAYDSLTPTTC